MISSVASQTNSVSEPGGRNKPGFVYDSGRKLLFCSAVLAKGAKVSAATHGNGTGKSWKQIAVDGPEKRGGMGMTYDSDRKKVVLFGGVGDGATFGDTWEWDGKIWKKVAASGPSARVVPQIVYDASRKKTVLFGGLDNSNRQPLGDTWEWDGSNWREISLTGPAPRFHHFMVYDSSSEKIILFGGMGAKTDSAQTDGERFLGDTWELDGRQWTKVSDAGPHKRDHHAMSYDNKRKKVVLFGGWNGTY